MELLGIFAGTLLMIGAIWLVIWAFGESTGVSAIDLESVVQAMISRHGWVELRARQAEVEYRKFLVLIKQRPGHLIIPWRDEQGRDDLDQFWHQHILDTFKYDRDCRRVFGRVVHHDPNVPPGSAKEVLSSKLTKRSYEKTFGGVVYGQVPAAPYVSGCGGVIDTSSHSSSHSDGGGHSGCGGHGCGHGCGGGCGGH